MQWFVDFIMQKRKQLVLFEDQFSGMCDGIDIPLKRLGRDCIANSLDRVLWIENIDLDHRIRREILSNTRAAVVNGHGPGQEVLQTGKMHVVITGINTVGHYALQFVFDDGHDTGLYSWDYLYQLCVQQDEKWERYLKRMDEAGEIRDPAVQVLKL